MANPGTCCQNGQQQGAWKQVVSYHDLCDHSQVPEYIEIGFHDYEASCENHFCNLIGPGVDQTVCPYSPPAPPAAPPAADTGIASGTLVAVIVVGVVVLLLAFSVIAFMVSKEKAGKPIFTSLTSPRGGASV